MPDNAKFQRYAAPFLHKGLDLNHPPDLLAKSGLVPLATNVRSYAEGTIQQRPGLTALNSSAIADTNIHSGRQLNNPLPSAAQAYANFIGAGTALYSDNSAHNAFTSRATGYSGNPLFFIQAQPAQSPEFYMYVGDSSKMSKSKVDGTTQNWGVAPPTTMPSVTLSAPNFAVIDDMEAGTFADWAASAGALTNPDRLAAVVISQLLYDTGTTGWCLVNPASMTDIREGMFVTMSVNTETKPIDSIYKAVTTTTIGSIQYASGTTGLCTIQLAAPTAELQMNSMLRIAAAENVRVLSVTYGPDGTPSFQCVTTGTRSAGDVVAGLDAFRIYFTNTHTTADTLTTKMLNLVTAAAGITTLTRVANFDLSLINSRPVTDEDYISIQVQVSDPALIDKDIQVIVDVDAATAAAGDVGTKNYYFHNIRAADLQPAATQTLADLTVQQRVVQRDQLDAPADRFGGLDVQRGLGWRGFTDEPDIRNPFTAGTPTETLGTGVGSSTTQTVPGTSQWSVFYIPLSAFERAGSDTSRSWKNVKGIKVSFSATAIITVKVDAWWIGGTYGPNTTLASPYYYVYRYRSSSTGAKSAPSPPTRSGFDVMRGQLVLTPTVSTDTQVDKIDWFRFGGTLNNFRYVGTQANSGTFSDHFADSSLDLTPLGILPADNDGISLDIMPFPVIDIPRTGTCNVVGTEVTWVSGDTFNTAWIRNNQIIIEGDPYTFYANPSSTTRLSTNENVGTKTAVTFYIPGAIMQGQTLDAYFGPWGVGEAGVTIFGVKDGVLYWTNGNDPDSCAKGNRLVVAANSEPLMNGCVYDGRPFVFSSERMWEIQPNQITGFNTQIIGFAKGLYARWGLAVGDVIYYIWKDGIYAWPGDGGPGGNAPTITGATLQPLFPHDGQLGVATNGVSPPDFTLPTKLRLNYSDSQLYFDYQAQDASRAALVFANRMCVGQDVYGKTLNFHYGSEGSGRNTIYGGGIDGKVYTMLQTALDDGGTVFTCTLRTPAVNNDDPRTKKVLSDCYAELQAVDGTTVTATPYVDNYVTAQSVTSITGTGARNQSIIDLEQETQTFVYNLGLQLSWTSDANAKLFNWEWSYYFTTIDVSNWQTLDITHGLEGYFIMHRAFIAHASTSDVTLTLYLNGDETAHSSYTVANGGGEYRKTPVMFQPIKTKSVRYHFSSDAPFRIYAEECECLARSWVMGQQLQPLRFSGGIE